MTDVELNYTKEQISQKLQVIKENAEERKYKLDKLKKNIQESGLKFRYFRNNRKDYKKTSLNHGGVICIGYKVIGDNESGCKFLFAVSFCSPSDHFSRFEAKKHIYERYVVGEALALHVDYGSVYEFDDIIRSIWNSHKLPLEQLGIKPIIPGRKPELKPWMKYIR